MRPRADVHSIEAIREFRTALIVFLDEAQGALESLGVELSNSLDWLEHQQGPYWQGQIRHAHDRVAQARLELSRAKMITVAGNRKSCIEEKQALEAAKRRRDLCESKREEVRRWSIKCLHESDDLQGLLTPLKRVLETELPQLVHKLGQMLRSLEAYAESGPPRQQATDLFAGRPGDEGGDREEDAADDRSEGEERGR